MSDNKVMKKRNALGRGLGALLNNSEDQASSSQSDAIQENAPTPHSSINHIPLDSIETNPYQPRTYFDHEALEELAESIRVQGIIQPITVRQLSANQYQLISGERRFQASKLAGLTELPAYVRTANDQQMLEMALIENIQRENLNAVEVALSYQRLISECNLKQEELGERVGKKRSTVNNYLRLLRLPPEIQASVRDNKISMGHARAIVNIENVDVQLAVFHRITTEDLSVRRVEEIVRDISLGKTTGKPAPPKAPVQPSPDIVQVQRKLVSHFGTKVEIKANEKNKGEIKIPFVSQDDLNRILELLNL
jgi:ParB family transcriptional regulator, chromosome partitioning protein